LAVKRLSVRFASLPHSRNIKGFSS